MGRPTGVLVGLVCVVLVASAGWAQEGAAPPAEIGTIAGVVTDKAGGSPIIEAGVEVVGPGVKTTTDIDGRYTVKVAPGTYDVRIFAPLYQAVRLQKVVVKPNQVTRVSAALQPSQAGVEVVEVVARADKAAEATQLQERRKAAVVSETVSAETIKKSPDTDAAEVVQRVPAVTVKDDKYIFVRGLGERYSSALLNGSRLPSTDPDKRVVPLDLFPADFVESISIVKSYTPDLPGDFSGGLADIRLREFPEKLSYSLGLSGGANTQATFRPVHTYPGGSLDYLGLGGSARNLPASFPDTKEAYDRLPPAERFRLARGFKDVWSPDTTAAPPNTGMNFSIGDSLGPLGLNFAGIYTTEWKQHFEVKAQNVNGGRKVGVVTPRKFHFDVSTFETRLGGIMTAAYKLGANHKLTFRSLLDRNASDEVQNGFGRDVNFAQPFNPTSSLRYTEEQLAYGQLAGEHRFGWIWLDWRSAFSQTTQDVPDARYITYIGDRFSSDSSGGLRTYGALSEYLTDSALDFTIPFKTWLPFTDVWSDLPAKVKFGPAYAFRDRDFTLRRLRFVPQGGVDLRLPPEQLLGPSNIAPGAVELVDQTQPKDSFKVSQEILAGYGMLDLPLVQDRLRIVGGVREEYSYIVLHSFDDQGRPLKVIKKNVDPLPGVNLIFSPREDMNFRFGWSESVSRPEFRELQEVLLPTLRGEEPLVGNTQLVQSSITSYDGRWEWFFSPLELVSFSIFMKDLDKPIEKGFKQFASGIAVQYLNAASATLRGFEFEGRKNFGFLSPRLADLSLNANVAYVDSEATLCDLSPKRCVKKFGPLTSFKRQLVGQAPYVVNAALDYTHPGWGTVRLLYNTAGSRIDTAAGFQVPDVFEKPRHQLDFVLIAPLGRFSLPLSAKFAAENLFNDRIDLVQGDKVFRRYTTGVKFSLGLTYTF